MVSLNMNLSLDDIAIALDMTSNSKSECQEVMDFVLGVDQSMCDVDWTVELVSRLAISVAEDVQPDGFADAALRVFHKISDLAHLEGATHSQIITALADEDSYLIIQIMADVLAVQRREAEKARRRSELCLVCQHPMFMHNGGEHCIRGFDTTKDCHACTQA
jgi:hypothetical protein